MPMTNQPSVNQMFGRPEEENEDRSERCKSFLFCFQADHCQMERTDTLNMPPYAHDKSEQTCSIRPRGFFHWVKMTIASLILMTAGLTACGANDNAMNDTRNNGNTRPIGYYTNENDADRQETESTTMVLFLN